MFHYIYIYMFFISLAPQMRKQSNALVNSFRMAWKIIRSSLSQNGKVNIVINFMYCYSMF